MQLPDIAITGATGKLGGLVAERLLDQGHQARLLVRQPDRLPRREGSFPLPCDYGEPEQAVMSLTGVRTLFMVSAHEGPARVDLHRAMIDAAREAGVEHVVYTSLVSAGPDATFTLARDHAATEDLLQRSGLQYTVLRDNLYLDFAQELIGPDDAIRGPAADGRAAMVARADVAEVACSILLDPQAHEGCTHHLTGPEALGLDDVARLFTQSWARLVQYHPQTPEQARRSRAGDGVEPWQVEAWVSTYTAIAAGEFAQVSDDVPRLLGRPATSLAQLLGID